MKQIIKSINKYNLLILGIFIFILIYWRFPQSELLSEFEGKYSKSIGVHGSSTLTINNDGSYFYSRVNYVIGDRFIESKGGFIEITNNKFIFKNLGSLEGLHYEYYPIWWEGKRYLISSDEKVDFCNAMNSGSKLGGKFFFSFIEDRGNTDSEFSRGYDYFQSCFLEKPISGKVVKFAGDFIVINLGEADGTYQGMRLFLWNYEKEDFCSLEITKLNTESSTAKLSPVCSMYKITIIGGLVTSSLYP